MFLFNHYVILGYKISDFSSNKISDDLYNEITNFITNNNDENLTIHYIEDNLIVGKLLANAKKHDLSEEMFFPEIFEIDITENIKTEVADSLHSTPLWGLCVGRPKVLVFTDLIEQEDTYGL